MAKIFDFKDNRYVYLSFFMLTSVTSHFVVTVIFTILDALCNNSLSHFVTTF